MHSSAETTFAEKDEEGGGEMECWVPEGHVSRDPNFRSIGVVKKQASAIAVPELLGALKPIL